MSGKEILILFTRVSYRSFRQRLRSQAIKRHQLTSTRCSRLGFTSFNPKWARFLDVGFRSSTQPTPLPLFIQNFLVDDLLVLFPLANAHALAFVFLLLKSSEQF